MSKKKRNTPQQESFSTFRRNDTGHVLGIDFTENPEQRELIRLMNQNNLPVVFCFGRAGTGKTFTALAAAIDLVRVRKKYKKIFYIREPLEVGKSLGFLPGNIDEKYGVYLDGLDDNLEHISTFSGINKNDMRYNIECVPPQFTRGRSWEDSIILVDEAQNLSLDTIQTLVTRLGKFCKIVFLGSMNQIDIKGKTKENNDFSVAHELLKDLDVVGSVELVKSERSEYAALFDDIFTRYKEEKNKG